MNKLLNNWQEGPYAAQIHAQQKENLGLGSP